MQAEFDDLTTRGRIMVAEKIERARELGDLKENGDYHAAKDEQGHMEGRIRQLEYLLENGEIVEAKGDGEVTVGQKISIVYEGDSDDMAETYIIGHVEEQKDGYDIVSPGSPLGSALLGAKVGQEVAYQAPNGELKVKILAAEPA
jgi:transcription elongation factor GreA